MSTVLVLGASPKETRYSYLATESLLARGHRVIPVRPALGELLGQKAYDTIADAKAAGPVDTVTVYVNADVSTPMEPALIDLAPRRVIFNPGAENRPLALALETRGIATLEACTLVLLQSGKF